MTVQHRLRSSIAIPGIALLLTGCVSVEQAALYANPKAGFSTVSAATSSLTKGKQSVWIQSQEDARENARSIHALIHKKTISADTAVQVALLNNRGLQAAYASLGISAAEAWQQTMLENPRISIGLLGIGAPELGLLRAVEGMIAANILALATQKRRIDIADTKFRTSQSVAVSETLRLATETRRAWINAAISVRDSELSQPGEVGGRRRVRTCAQTRRERCAAESGAGSRTCLLCRIDRTSGRGAPVGAASQGRS